MFTCSFLGVNSVINHPKTHVLGGTALEVKPFYPFFENTARKKSDIECDSEVFTFIQRNHEHELQSLLDENKMELTLDQIDTSILTVSSSEKKNDSYNSWQERIGSLRRFVGNFVKISIPIASEIYEEVVQRWKKQSSILGPCNVLLSFDDNKRQALIIGGKKYLEKEKQRLHELIHEITEDAELMKSIVEVCEADIPKSRLILLQMSGICERLQKENQHLRISFEDNGKKLCLKGPRILLHKVMPEVLGFTSKTMEQTLVLTTKIVNVLKRPQVSDFMQGLLKQSNIQAIFVYNQTENPNEVQVVGVGPESIKEAISILKNTTREEKFRLTRESAVVLRSPSWNDFQSKQTSKFKVGISAELLFNTVCVSGITEDVKESFEQVKHFLEANTILQDSFLMDEGTTRFMVQRWGSKLERIKKDLATYFVDMKITPTYEGIQVSGTAEGLKKCKPKLDDLLKVVQQTKVPINKRSMKKFILQGEDPELLKSIEDRNECVILVKEILQEKAAFIDIDKTNRTTNIPGIRIIVKVGDLTKEEVI